MKKILALIMSVVFCFSITSCNTNTTEGITEDPNTIELTMDNYEDYLKIKGISIENNGSAQKIMIANSYETFYAYNEIKFVVETEGVSPNLIYNNVTVTVQFSGKYDAYPIYFESYSDVKENTFEFDIEVNVNVGGGGEGIYILDIGSLYTTKDEFTSDAKIIAVTGSVTLVK